jgi:hypothetical protein
MLVASMQLGSSVSAQSQALPEAIYWKQTLFQIPYQWNSAAEPGAAHVVHLLVSKDRGATWQKISEARPDVTSFNYRAEGDGEYWFAVRTIDRQGREWPTGDYQPELRVIVDTSIPRIDSLQAVARAGSVEVAWSGSDSNLDPASWSLDVQMTSNGPWLPVPPANYTSNHGNGSAFPPSGHSSGQASWPLPVGQPPIALRATVADRAGNSATFRTEIRPAQADVGTVKRLPAPTAELVPSEQPPFNSLLSGPAATSVPAPPTTPTTNSAPGWVSGSEATTNRSLSKSTADQEWPPSSSALSPFRLWSSGIAATTDPITSYGNPQGIDTLRVEKNGSNEPSPGGVKAQYAAAGPLGRGVDMNPAAVPMNEPSFQPLQPFRQAAVSQQRAAESNAPTGENQLTPIASPADVARVPPTNAYPTRPADAVVPKLVGSRTFALEYELEDVGQRGVSRVELWGTRDGGQSWRLYAEDEDQRSPLIVTVDEEDTYGFRIVVHSVGGSTAPRPQPGDNPELWITVDLRQPVAEITAIESGAGNLADHLILYWRAQDDNLTQRPVSLYYASGLNGPWSTVAANLENTGEYAWRVERHVPERFYLRLEVRDSAGNVAAFRTREPITFAVPTPTAQLNSAESIDTTTTWSGASYR